MTAPLPRYPDRDDKEGWRAYREAERLAQVEREQADQLGWRDYLRFVWYGLAAIGLPVSIIALLLILFGS